MNELSIKVTTLDAGFGYNLVAYGIVEGQRIDIREHYPTEAALQVRLVSIWQAWAAQVDAE